MRKLIGVALLATAMCMPPPSTLVIQRRPSGAIYGQSGPSDGAQRRISLPRQPLLNRFDIVGSERAVDFRDYFQTSDVQIGNASWLRARELELANAQALLADTRTGGAPDPGPVTISKVVLSFVHITDVQIRQATAKLGDERQSKGLDRLVNSFEHDYHQELYIDVMYEALVDTVNQTLNEPATTWPPLPSFVIHTGDAIDSGLESELETFLSITNSFQHNGTRIPWLAAIGNHDVLTMGNFIPGRRILATRLIGGGAPRLENAWYWFLIWLGAHVEFLVPEQIDMSHCEGCVDQLVARPISHTWMNEKNATVKPPGLVDDAFAAPFIHAHRDGTKTMIGDKTSELHGFDLGPPASPCATKSGTLHAAPAPPDNLAGYYFVDIKTEDQSRTIRLVVLDTSDYACAPIERAGSEGGYVGAAQVAWLKSALAPVKSGEIWMALVFGHHPITTFRNDGNARAVAEQLFELAEKNRLIGYITGHTHENHISVVCPATLDRKSCKLPDREAFWEVQTSSIIGFPQEGRWITVREVGDLGFLELLPFSHGFVLNDATPFRRLLGFAERGAKRDACRKTECLDGEPIRRDGVYGAARLFFRLPK